MPTIDDLAAATHIGVDTSPLIYFVERNQVYVAHIRQVFGLIDSGTVQALSSAIALTEVLVHPYRAGDTGLQQRYRDLLLNSENFSLAPVSITISQEAARLRAYHNLRLPDALHIATAMEYGCDAFLTNDPVFKRVPGIKEWID